mmetsp:Transcript_17553/g.37119  ORF Transcript_17553/g.37119 Transcript_17553/m.37119 type:complete len:373 (-) Transcript_17553:15-1133(-)
MTSMTSLVVPPSARRRSAAGLKRMVSIGTKSSGAHFFSLRYLMHSMAVASASTTIASMFLPMAMVTAASYLRCVGLHTSVMRPWTPGKRRLRFSRASLDRFSRSESFCSTFDALIFACSSATVARSSPCRLRACALLLSVCFISALSCATPVVSSLIRSALACLRSFNALIFAANDSRSAVSSSTRVRYCWMACSLLPISRVFACILSWSSAVLFPASALRRLYSSCCFLPRASSPVASACACSFSLRAISSVIWRSSSSSLACSFWLFSNMACCLSSDLTFVSRRRSRCFISSLSLIDAGLCCSSSFCTVTSFRSSSTQVRARRERSFSLAFTFSSASEHFSEAFAACVSSSSCCWRRAQISLSTPSSLCR